jgi:hypothetical protein
VDVRDAAVLILVKAGGDGLRYSWVMDGERAQKPEAAREHHVAVRDGEIGAQRRALEKSPPWAGDREERETGAGFTRFLGNDKGAVALTVEYLLMGERPRHQPLQEPLQLVPAELAGMVLEEAAHLTVGHGAGEGMKVPHVNQEDFLLGADLRVLEGAKERRRRRVHDQ